MSDLRSYLGQDTVRGREFRRFLMPERRRRVIRLVIVFALAAFIGWFATESLTALITLGH